MTTIRVIVDGPRAAMNRNAMITAGSASTASTIRPVITSKVPPKKPMARPRAVPRMVPRMVASGVTIRMSLAPTMTRDSTSRPRLSVPNQCAPDGGLLLNSSCCASGLYGAIACPKSAQITQNTMMIAPTMKVGRRSSSRQAARGTAVVGTATAIMSPVGPSGPPGSSGADPSTPSTPPGSAVMSVMAGSDPQPRVERDQQQVRRQRGQHVDHADKEHPRFQHREVMDLRGLEDQVADARVVEQGLDHDQAADQVSGLGRDDRDRGEQRVAQDVPPDHGRPGQSLEDRRPGVVRVQRFDGPRPGHPGDVPEQHEDQRDGGQDQMPELVPVPGARAGRGGHRQYLQRHAEYHDQYDSGHEF